MMCSMISFSYHVQFLNICLKQVVLSQVTHLYFDHPYEPDPEERGYYWGPRFTDTRKTFGFMPDTLYQNADVKRNGEPYTEEQLCQATDCVPLNRSENIIGECRVIHGMIMYLCYGLQKQITDIISND